MAEWTAPSWRKPTAIASLTRPQSTIMVMKGTTQRQVIYNSDTKWMYGTQANNKPSSLDDLKENWYVSSDECLV